MTIKNKQEEAKKEKIEAVTAPNDDLVNIFGIIIFYCLILFP